MDDKAILAMKAYLRDEFIEMVDMLMDHFDGDPCCCDSTEYFVCNPVWDRAAFETELTRLTTELTESLENSAAARFVSFAVNVTPLPHSTDTWSVFIVWEGCFPNPFRAHLRVLAEE